MFEDVWSKATDGWNSLTSTATGTWDSFKNRLFPPAQPTPSPQGGRSKTYRRKGKKKSKRRRTGRKSSHP